MTPKMTRRKKPKILAFFPNFLDANLPMAKPNMVNRKLTIEKISIADTLLLVIADKPNPVEKASMETPKAKRKIPKNEKSISVVSSFLCISHNRLPAIKRRIHPKNRLLFKAKKETILSPIRSPK